MKLSVIATTLMTLVIQQTSSLPFNYYESAVRNRGCMEKLTRELRLDEKFRLEVERRWIELDLQRLIDTVLIEMEAICTVEETDAIHARLSQYKNYIDVLYDWISETTKDERIFIKEALEHDDNYSLYKFIAQKFFYMLVQPRYASRIFKSLLLSFINGIRSTE